MRSTKGMADFLTHGRLLHVEIIAGVRVVHEQLSIEMIDSYNYGVTVSTCYSDYI